MDERRGHFVRVGATLGVLLALLLGWNGLAMRFDTDARTLRRTFQKIAYVVHVHRGDAPVIRNPLEMALTRAGWKRGRAWRLLRPVAWFAVIVACLLFADSGAQQFIYFQF